MANDMKYGKDRLTRLNGIERLGQNRQSEYLGAEDITPGTEPIVTIEGLYFGSVTLQRGREDKDVIAFVERSVPGINKVRPLIVNSTNRKTLRKLYGDASADCLVGKQIQLWIDHNVRDPQDGGKTDGIRIRPFVPRPVQADPEIPCTDCGQIIGPALGKSAKYMIDYTTKHYSVPLCAECAAKRKAAQAEQEDQSNA